MKNNRVKKGRKWPIIIILLIGVLTTAIVGLVMGFDYLRDKWREQCVIVDMERQVTIESGKMVHPGNIAAALGLKRGANLATIDFDAKRTQLLADIPNLRSVRITRLMPDRVIVATEERTPVAKMGIKGRRGGTGLVVDSEGVVFSWQRGTQMLPTIYEPPSRATGRGKRIEGRSLAALNMVESCRDPAFSELNVQDIDTSNPDYLMATLGNYSTVKIAWEGMDEPTASSKVALDQRLKRLVQAIRTHIAPGTKVWNATMADMIFADTQEKQ